LPPGGAAYRAGPGGTTRVMPGALACNGGPGRAGAPMRVEEGGSAMRQQIEFVRNHPLGRRAPLRAWANILAWQIRSRLARGAVRCRWVGESVLMVRRGMTGATGNLYVGLHEFADMGFVLHFLRRGDLFVDVGANVGSYTVLAGRGAGAAVVAFEPDPDTAAHLADNIAANAIGERARIVTQAVGSESGIVRFSRLKDTVNHVLAADAPAEAREVPITTLDSALAGQHPALIKIDVEGHEPAVVAGAESVLADPALKAIILESHDAPTLAVLSRHGFRQCSYDPFTRSLAPKADHRWGGNCLFVRDEAQVAQRVATAHAVRILGQRV
jgi:FkbM family methyltransferase